MKTSFQKCVGCGFCCMKAKCYASARLYPSADSCPALIWSESDTRYICNLMTIPGKVGEGYREELYAGAGCGSSLNTWRLDVKKREKVNNSIKNLDSLFQMFLKALGIEMMSGDKLFLIISNFEDELQKNGLPEEEIQEIRKLVVYNIKNNRNKLFDSFIGEFKE